MSGTNGDAAGWSWAPDLDGPTAAPDHHKVIFENERVRVLETTIRAGERTPPAHPPGADLVVIGVELKGGDSDTP